MKRVLVILLVAAGLVLAPYAGSVNAQGSTSGRPPVEQPLVSEGEFAVELATALHLTSTHDEAAAENSLAAINIAPRNGWISDYPMTPDIIAEVSDSAARSASSGSLNISEADATRTVDSVSIAMDLPVKVAGENYTYESSSGSSSDYSSSSSSEYQSSYAAPRPEYTDYVEPTDVDQYYDQYGPPVVSYYPPPWAYGYLYDWVPWPFWWGGFGFGGFFILGDFDGHFHHGDHGHGDHDHHFSNHVTHANGTVSRVNAVTRATGTGTRGSSTLAGASRSSQTLAGASRSTQGSRLSSANAQAGARAIMNRQASRAGNTTGTSTTSRNFASSGSSRNMGNTNGSSRNPVS
ncbi:MAG: hypothetical protein ACLQSW_05785, partial [Syntrophobacteraceae bacterium]